MKTHVFKGSKEEIAARLVQLNGEVREAIVFEDEPLPAATEAAPQDTEDIFAEMCPFMVEDREMDDSRAAIYPRMQGE